MKRSRVILLGLLGGVFLLAFPLAFLGRDLLVLPLSKAWFYIKGYYAALPQGVYWVVVLLVVGVIAIFSLLVPEMRLGKKARETRQRGEVGQLAFWIARLRKGEYAEWYVARILSRLALEIVRVRMGNAGAVTLGGPGWNPPEGVKKTLEMGLHSSRAGYSNRNGEDPVPNELVQEDARAVIEYLESELMESDHEDRR